MNLCPNGHLKTQGNLIQLTRCKICRYNRQKESRKRLLQARYQIINQLKSVPCTDCKKSYIPFLMDFDHIKGKKYKNISQMVDRNSWEKILAEIKKCEVVCSNCHRARTFKRSLVNLST